MKRQRHIPGTRDSPTVMTTWLVAILLTWFATPKVVKVLPCRPLGIMESLAMAHAIGITTLELRTSRLGRGQRRWTTRGHVVISVPVSTLEVALQPSRHRSQRCIGQTYRGSVIHGLPQVPIQTIRSHIIESVPTH